MTFRGSSSWTDMRHTRTLSRVAPSYASGRVPSSLKPPSHSQRVKRPPCLSWGQPLPQNLQMDLCPLAPIWLMHPVCSPRSDPGITNQNHKLAPLGHSFVLLLATPHGFWVLAGQAGGLWGTKKPGKGWARTLGHPLAPILWPSLVGSLWILGRGVAELQWSGHLPELLIHQLQGQ